MRSCGRMRGFLLLQTVVIGQRPPRPIPAPGRSGGNGGSAPSMRLNTCVFFAVGSRLWSSSSWSTWSPSLACRVTYCSWTPHFSLKGCCPVCWGAAPCGSSGRWWRLSWIWKRRPCYRPKDPKLLMPALFLSNKIYMFLCCRGWLIFQKTSSSIFKGFCYYIIFSWSQKKWKGFH